MQIGIITLFPEMFNALNLGIVGRAQKNKIIEISFWNPRDFTTDKHKSVDDYPYGGGPGMVMMVEPLLAALQAAKEKLQNALVIYLSPQGKIFNQQAAANFTHYNAIIFLAGRYEGVDERLIQQAVDEEWSIGDYILTGGELPAMAMIDTITRLLPGVVGDSDSINQDSLTSGLLKYPQYTKPLSVAGQTVPDVLLSGNHLQIHRWRLKLSLGKTWLKRPDLLIKKNLSAEEQSLLTEFIEEFNKNTK